MFITSSNFLSGGKRERRRENGSIEAAWKYLKHNNNDAFCRSQQSTKQDPFFSSQQNQQVNMWSEKLVFQVCSFELPFPPVWFLSDATG